MDKPLVSPRAPEPEPAPPRRPWIVPRIESLGEMRNLTLQGGSLGGDCPFDDPGCFFEP